MSAKTLRVEGVTRTFPGRGRTAPTLALQPTDVSVAPGEFVAILGPSGCGKSTLLRIVAGLDAPTAGRVLLDAVPVTGPGPDRGMVFQDYGLFPWLSVTQNIAFGPIARGRPKSEAAATARRFVEMVGLTRFAEAYPHQLSGGMKQRVAIARVLANDAEVVLMDEPFGALDAMTRETMNVELLKLRERTGATIMLVTHSIPEAVFLGDRVVVMSPRPGRVTQVIDVDLPHPRSLDMINTDRFGTYVSGIRANLNAAGGLD